MGPYNVEAPDPLVGPFGLYPHGHSERSPALAGLPLGTAYALISMGSADNCFTTTAGAARVGE